MAREIQITKNIQIDEEMGIVLIPRELFEALIFRTINFEFNEHFKDLVAADIKSAKNVNEYKQILNLHYCFVKYREEIDKYNEYLKDVPKKAIH